MNDKQKKNVIIICFMALVLCLIVQSFVYSWYFRRADRTIDSLERQLLDVRTELDGTRRTVSDCAGTIRDCRKSVTTIADGIGNDNAELKGIIANLKQIRTEIENMENTLNLFYDKYGNIDFGLDNTGGTVE